MSIKRTIANVYTIPSAAPFLGTLASALMDDRFDFGIRVGEGPSSVDLQILLPTRRACRALREILFHRIDKPATFLPRIRPIGDVDEDDLALTTLPGGQSAAELRIPSSLSGLDRDLSLMRLVMAWRDKVRPQIALPGGSRPPDLPSTTAEALALAQELGRLLDNVETEGGDLRNLRKLVPDDFAEHFGLSLQFLDVVTAWWPQFCAERGEIGAAERRNRLLDAETVAIEQGYLTCPIIAAGSTGSIPASARLLTAIAQSASGALVLPGLDPARDQNALADLLRDPPAIVHPQYGMAQLLQPMNISPEEIISLDVVGRDPETARNDRVSILNHALASVEETVDWPELQSTISPDRARHAFSRTTLIEADGEDEEALAIAIALRHVAETDTKTAALVTTDRNLSSRVIAHLRRWAIEIDDSGGQPLLGTPQGVLAEALLEMMESDFAPIPLLAFLKHPLVRLRYGEGTVRAQTRALELSILRGPRPKGGLAGLRDALSAKDLEEGATAPVLEMLDRLESAINPLRLVVYGNTSSTVALDKFARFLWSALLDITTDDAGLPLINDGDEGEALRGLLEGLAGGQVDGTDIPTSDLSSVFRVLARGIPVRRTGRSHPRLHVFGLLEARLQPMDLVILAGLNEGSWPDIPTTDPWLSRPMRASAGLSAPEKRIGLMAHDFVQAAAAPEVIFSRSRKSNGAPTIPSRFLQRLKAVLEALDVPDCLEQGPARSYIDWARRIDEAPYLPINEPRPKPPVFLRPRSLSVTSIETWIRDSYGLYADKVLGLRPLVPVDSAPGASDRGTVIHEALARLLAKGLTGNHTTDHDALLAYGREAFLALQQQPEVMAIWWPRFERIADWFINNETLQGGAAEIHVECAGELLFDAPGGPFKLTARADRIDITDNRATLIDYKTGEPPNARQVASGLSPQLSLEAAILRHGRFSGLPASVRSIEALTYFKLNGGTPAVKIVPVGAASEAEPDKVDHLSDVALSRLKTLVAAYDNPDQPYLVMSHAKLRSRFCDTTHLSRFQEWSALDDEEGDG